MTEFDHMLAIGLLLLSAMLAFGRTPPELDAAGRRSFYLQGLLTGAVLAALPLLVWYAADRPLAGFAAQNWIGERPWMTASLAALWAALLFAGVLSVKRGWGRVRLTRIYSDFPALMPESRAELHRSWGAAIGAGAGEEIAYRGFLLWYASVLLGPAAAVVVTSLAFGVAHGYQRRTGVIFASAAGLFLALVALASGSLLLVMWMHATYNMASFAVGMTVLRDSALRSPTAALPVGAKV